MIEELSLPLPFTQTIGSQADLSGLVNTYTALLFRVAYSVLRNQGEAEDVVQDAFVRVIEHQSDLATVRDLRVWLVRVTWNLALDRRRRVRPEQMDEAFAQALAAEAQPADRQLHSARRLAAVLTEMDRLPRSERQALLLSALEELDTAEIAEVMQRSASGVRALLFRARERLRERLTGKGYA